MIVTIKGTILKVTNKTGLSKKDGKAYNFCSASFVDDDSNVFSFNVDSDFAEKVGVAALLKLKNKEVTATLNLYPKGYNIACQLVDYK